MLVIRLFVLLSILGPLSHQGPGADVAEYYIAVKEWEPSAALPAAFLASVEPRAKKTYRIFYGNRTCRQPVYDTDLRATGPDYGLDVENRYYKVILAKSMGQRRQPVGEVSPAKRDHAQRRLRPPEERLPASQV